MRKEYDFSKLKVRRNPYARLLKRQITIRISNNAIDYFKDLANDVGVPYQNLIDSYLSECASKRRRLHTKWA